jgi:hypothetical protein
VNALHDLGRLKRRLVIVVERRVARELRLGAAHLLPERPQRGTGMGRERPGGQQSTADRQRNESGEHLRLS